MYSSVEQAPSQGCWAIAAVAAAPIACLSYAVVRLLGLTDESPPTEMLATAHIPFFWRAGLAAIHGVGGGISLALLTPPRHAAWVLERMPPWVVMTVILSAVAMVWRP